MSSKIANAANIDETWTFLGQINYSSTTVNLPTKWDELLILYTSSGRIVQMFNFYKQLMTKFTEVFGTNGSGSGRCIIGSTNISYSGTSELEVYVYYR